MCGGGGGGDGGVAERQAAMKAEQDRAIQEVNLVFGKGEGSPVYRTDNRSLWGMDIPTQVITGYDTTQRDKNAAARTELYGKITSDASARLLDKLGRERDVAARGTRFQLARQGLAGGSADVDQNSEILSRFQEGSLEAANSAAAAGNGARMADEKTRVGIINNIRNGMAQSDAVSNAYASLQNNAAEARDAGMAATIGDFFGGINAANQQRQFQMGQDNIAKRYGSNAATSGNTGGFSGRISG